MRILLVEDDETIGQNIALSLKRQNYVVDLVATAGDGYQKTCDETYDLVILDWMLPDYSGTKLCSQIRADESEVPILMLTARMATDDRVEGLDAGADDYLTKPFAMAELLARVRALLRRRHAALTPPTITIGNLRVDTNDNSVTIAEIPISLTPREYALLHYLAINAGRAVDRMELLTHAWGENTDLFSNTVDVHISFLRKKMDTDGARQLIKTVKGKGYMLCTS